jgi:hemerythrin
MDAVEEMDAGKHLNSVKNIVFKRVPGVDYSVIRNDVKMFNIFLSVDGERSVRTIAEEDYYDSDYLFQAVDNMEKIGLIIPIDGAESEDPKTSFEVKFCNLPKEFRTGIETVDNQHQRLVSMVNILDDVRRASYQSMNQKQKAVGEVIIEMVDYTVSHFAFEESLMEDAKYKFYEAHKRIHELFIKRAGEYKERWASGEDIADELFSVLKRWLFNHIRNDDKAYAPSLLKRIKEKERANRGWISLLLKRFFK